jgi:hypothetical protein
MLKYPTSTGPVKTSPHQRPKPVRDTNRDRPVLFGDLKLPKVDERVVGISTSSPVRSRLPVSIVLPSQERVVTRASLSSIRVGARTSWPLTDSARRRSTSVRVDGREYDSKAIAGVAHGYQFPSAGPLSPDEFSGGEATVVPELESLGFEVVTHKVAAQNNPDWATDELILALDLYLTKGALDTLTPW